MLIDNNDADKLYCYLVAQQHTTVDATETACLFLALIRILCFFIHWFAAFGTGNDRYCNAESYTQNYSMANMSATHELNNRVYK